MGIGLGGNDMENVDMISATFISDTAYDLMDTYSTDDNFPDNDIWYGGKNDLAVESYKRVNNFYQLIFTRPLNTNDKWDYKILKEGPTVFSVVWGPENYQVFHGDRDRKGSFTVDTTGTTVTYLWADIGYDKFKSPTMDYRTAYEAHGLILFITWALSFVGVIMARFYKHNGIWVWIHGIFMGLPTVSTLALSILAILAGIFIFLKLS